MFVIDGLWVFVLVGWVVVFDLVFGIIVMVGVFCVWGFCCFGGVLVVFYVGLGFGLLIG